MFNVPNNCRVPNTPGTGNNGVFVFKHPFSVGYVFFCMSEEGKNWERVSVSLQDHKKPKNPKFVKRNPTFMEMEFVKTVFWHEDAAVFQIHPPKGVDYYKTPGTLILWRPTNDIINLPGEEINFTPGLKTIK